MLQPLQTYVKENNEKLVPYIKYLERGIRDKAIELSTNGIIYIPVKRNLLFSDYAQEDKWVQLSKYLYTISSDYKIYPVVYSGLFAEYLKIYVCLRNSGNEYTPKRCERLLS